MDLSQLIPMGSLDMESPLLTQESEKSLFISLNILRQANLVQYRHASNKIVVFGIDHPHVYQEENSRSREGIKSALSTVLSLIAESTFEQDLKKRLIDIYIELPSPQTADTINPLSNKVDKATQRLLDSIVDLDAPDGMRTKLYDYQKKSIWKMLKRELCPGYILDPCLIPMKDMENNDYFIDYSDTGFGIYRTPTRKWDDVRGGILCEDMGTGKTCICIALILHTRHQFSMAPSPFTQLYSELAPLVPSDIDGVSDLFPQIYLSSATLVIVPANLVDQWCNEINKIHPYVDNKSLFSREMRKPFIDHNKASVSSGVALETLSSVKRLRHLLERLMTRNRPDDINRFVTLPPLLEKVVRLDLEYLQTLSLNSQIALIQANAVLTQREDQDYFFHPSNRKHLRQVIDNLNNGCFWYSGGENYTTILRETLQLSERGVEAALKYPPEDIALLKEVIKHLQLALSDPSWNTLVTAQEVGFFCQVPEAMQQEALIPSSSLCATPGDKTSVCILLANQISSLREVLRYEQRGLYPLETTISQTCILSSTSSKLNYVVSQILYHHTKEKCVVFCQSSNSIYYIREYLALAKIRCLTYHSGMAVKRAHRIGQTRPVHVETLVIRDSFEEAILNRRGELDKPMEPSLELSGDFRKGSRSGNVTVKKAKSMADDGKFRELISHIEFMPLPSKRNTILDLNDYVPIDVEDGAIKDLKIPIMLNGLGERGHSETEHNNDISTLRVKFEEEENSKIAEDDEIMAFDGGGDEPKMVKEEPKDEPMEVYEWYEIMDDDKKVKVDDEMEEPFKFEYVKGDREIEPTRKIEANLSQRSLEFVKRETSYEKEDNFKRVRFG
ncbi:hypothetical protein BGZ92_005484 [Podila epicladia]|nr:hypothetical protein BGZ92_005484 [Podila epicladia]